MNQEEGEEEEEQEKERRRCRGERKRGSFLRTNEESLRYSELQQEDPPCPHLAGGGSRCREGEG